MSKRLVIELPAASGVLYNRAGCLLLHATRETTGTGSAVYRLYDGSNTGGKVVLPVSLTASESTRDFFGRCVIPFHQGLFYELVSGTIEGDVVVLTHHDCEAWWARELERVSVEALHQAGY